MNLSHSHARQATIRLHAGGAMAHSYETKDLTKETPGPPDPIPLPATGREEEWGQGGNADARVGRRR